MTVNVDNINTVIAMIRSEEKARFDMHHYIQEDVHHPCGTAACIAGFACLAAGKNTDKFTTAQQYEDVAAKYLGFDDHHRYMFTAYDDGGRGYVLFEFITPEDAINVLEQIRDTGTFSWKFHEEYVGESY